MGTEIISKEFLEKALGRKVESFTIKSNAETGDNFASILYTLDVTVVNNNKGSSEKPEKETVHLLSKCYPSNPGRQEMLNEMDIFWKEIAFYKKWVPELMNFVDELGLKETVKLNFPTLVAGNAVNFENESVKENNNLKKKIYGPFDNFVMMIDLCKTNGFKLADRLVRLDMNHLSLVVESLAKYHALSWAYKTHKKIKVFKDHFPSLTFDYASSVTTFEKMMESNLDEALKSLKANPAITSEMITGVENFKKNSCNQIIESIYGDNPEIEKELDSHYRIKSTEKPESTETPWRLVIHGDCHMTNMLFRYNSENKAEEVVLLDMQLAREANLIKDLIYLMYTSTYGETRQKHTEEVLELYFKTFSESCKLFKTETPPGFTLKELTRRYNISKIQGMLMGLMAAPVMLKEKDQVIQLDSLEGMNKEEIMASLGKGMSSSARFNANIAQLVQEAYNDGII